MHKRIVYRYVISSLLLLSISALSGCTQSTNLSINRARSKQPVLTEMVVQLEPRPGVKLNVLLIKPENPIASIILFPGGPGYLGLTKTFGKPKINRINDVYLVRNRYNFAREGLMVALVDVPSDCMKKGDWGVRTKSDNPYKLSTEQIEDIKAVVAHLKSEKNCPVWIMGTSRGTLSVANAGINIKDGIDGLVFTSTLTERGEKHKFLVYQPNAVLDLDLEKITVPVLIVSHRDDYCPSSLPSTSEQLKDRLVNAEEVRLGFFSGGNKQEGSVCGWLSPHGFYGIDDRVDKQVANYIKSKTDSAYPEPIFQSELISFLEHRAVTFNPEEGKQFKILIAEPETPKGVFVMFRDVYGVLKIMESSDGPIMLWNKALVARAMDRLAKQGYVVVLVDAINYQRMSWEDGASEAYLHAIEPMFTFLKQEFNLPVWSVGHGPGGFAAINAAIHLPEVEALILISPIDRSKDKAASLKHGYLDLGLEEVKVPTLLIAHTKDSSGISGTRAAKNIRKALSNSPHVTIEVLSKGRPNSRLGSKWAKIPHFFVGRSDIVVESIVNYAEMNL